MVVFISKLYNNYSNISTTILDLHSKSCICIIWLSCEQNLCCRNILINIFSCQVVEAADQIVLNSCELELSDIKVIPDGGDEITITEPIIDIENEKAIFKLPAPLQPGKALLKLAFKGVITDKMKGFYCSKYYRLIYFSAVITERYCSLNISFTSSVKIRKNDMEL